MQMKYKIVTHIIKGNDIFPNNEKLSLIIYKNVLWNVCPTTSDMASAFETIVSRHEWHGSWRGTIYTYHHYHSTAHEGLGVYAGSAKVLFGGDENGIEASVSAGDYILIPAGVSHKCLDSSEDFGVVGSYPNGQTVDMNYGEPSERPRADENIARLPLPTQDPIFGKEGPVFDFWKRVEQVK
jgi:uncharacterized protein YjlB